MIHTRIQYIECCPGSVICPAAHVLGSSAICRSCTPHRDKVSARSSRPYGIPSELVLAVLMRHVSGGLPLGTDTVHLVDRCVRVPALIIMIRTIIRVRLWYQCVTTMIYCTHCNYGVTKPISSLLPEGIFDTTCGMNISQEIDHANTSANWAL